MVLRKPYALLIKNFKKIHFLLFVAIVYIAYTSNKILIFFNEYIKRRQLFFGDRLSSEYINFFLFFIVIIIISITTIIYILMNQKKKPRKLYLVMLIYYILLLVFFYVNYNYFNILQFEGLDPQTVRLIRDFNLISVITQVVFSVLVLVRAVGFDVKKFNFGEDIAELEIDITDNEEFELTSGINTDKVKVKYRKQLRELKYYYLEYKAIIIGILSIIIISIVLTIFLRIRVLNRIYGQDEYVDINKLNLKVNDVYYTKLNYKGEDISEKGYTYIIVNLFLNNKDTKERHLKLDNLKLETRNNIYNTTITRYHHFVDVGMGYRNQKIFPDAKRQYIIIFKVCDEDIGRNMVLRYIENESFRNGRLIGNYTRIRLNPVNLDDFVDVANVDVGKKVYYGLSLLKDTNLKINSIEVDNEFEYVVNDIKHYVVEPIRNKTILKISYELNLDKSVSYINSFVDILQKFGEIRYVKNNKQHNVEFSDITPRNYRANNIYLSVDNEIIDANELLLINTIRRKRYIHVLKKEI